MIEDKQISLFGYESDPDIVNKGEKQFHTALFTIHQSVDPALTFITYRFNRIGISHPELDAVCFINKDGIPTLGVNYEKFAKYDSLLAQIGVIEHALGHFMSGHVGNRLGVEARDYCIAKYGSRVGRKLYYLVTEAVADSYVNYPAALKKAGRPHYDLRKLGLDKWTHTLNVLKHIEDLLEKGQGEGGSGESISIEELLDHIASQMQDGTPREDRVDAEQNMMNDPLEMETGGADVKDLTIEPSKASALQGENNIRNTIKQALEACESAKSRGYMAGDMSQFIEADNVQPVVPWFQQVNQCVTRALSDERCITKKRLNRRDPDFGFGRLYQNTTTIVLVVDTSLSMYTDKADLSSVNSQADYLAQQADELWIVHNDADVAKAELYRRGMVLEEFFGCGGTDFEPALKYIRDELGIPDAIVFITDGYGGKLNDDDPVIGDWETELIWVLTPTGYTEDRFRESITNLGQVIKVESWV